MSFGSLLLLTSMLAPQQSSSLTSTEIVAFHNGPGAPGSEAARWVVNVSGVSATTSRSMDHPMGQYGFELDFKGNKGAWQILLDASKEKNGRIKVHYSALLEGKAMGDGNAWEGRDGRVYLHVLDRDVKDGVRVNKGKPSTSDLFADIYVAVQVSVRPAKYFEAKTRSGLQSIPKPALSLSHVDYRYRVLAPGKTLYAGHYSSDGQPLATIELNGKDLIAADRLEFFPTSFKDGKVEGTAVLTLHGTPYFCQKLQVENGKSICIAFSQVQHQMINGQDAIHVDSAEPRIGPRLKPNANEVVLELSVAVKDS